MPHRNIQKRQGKHSRRNETPTETQYFLLLAQFVRIGRLACFDLQWRIAGLFDGRLDFRESDPVRVVDDSRLRRRQIDIYLTDTVQFVDRPINRARAGSSGHPFDRNCDFFTAAFFPGLIPGFAHRFPDRF